jgi:hypothetical protein
VLTDVAFYCLDAFVVALQGRGVCQHKVIIIYQNTCSLFQTYHVECFLSVAAN